MASGTDNTVGILADGDLGGDQQALLRAPLTAASAWIPRGRGVYLAAAAAFVAAGLSAGIVLICLPRATMTAEAGAVKKAEVEAGPLFTSKTLVQDSAVLTDERGVRVFLAGLSEVSGGKEAKRWWLGMKMQGVKSIKSLKALHAYYSLAGAQDLFGGPYADQEEGQRARKVIEWGLHKYDGDDWTEYMNEEKATKKPPEGAQVGVGSTASLISQVYPPNEKFVILVLAWLPVGKYPWAGHGGVGAAHTHGQATCNFKFLNVVEGAGNTFYDIAGGASKVTDMFHDGKPHKGGCKDHDYLPVLVDPKAGKQFVPSKDLMGATSGFIQDDYGAHSIDNLNTTHIAYSVHVYYPPYAEAWAFHEKEGVHGQECERRAGAGEQGLSNCKHTHRRACTTTSMKHYLEAAADLKRYEEKRRKEHHQEQEDDEKAPKDWYEMLCASTRAFGGWLHAHCKGSSMQNDVSTDEVLDE